MVQRRPDNVEKYEQIAYSRKANNVTLKKRLLPSLFAEETVEKQDGSENKNTGIDNPNEKQLGSENLKQKRKNTKNSGVELTVKTPANIENNDSDLTPSTNNDGKSAKEASQREEKKRR